MAERLVRLSTPGRLYTSHRDGFERVRLALHIAGIESGTTDTLHAVRTVADQEKLFFARYTRQLLGSGKYGDVRWYKGVRYVRTSALGSAAIPGTSNHGRGDTVDFQGLGSYGSATWKRADPILREHGWSNAEGYSVGEPWHWTYRAANDKHANEEVITVSDFQQLQSDVAWIKKRLGGTTSQDSIARRTNETAAAVVAVGVKVGDVEKAQNPSAKYVSSGLAASVVKAAGETVDTKNAVDPKYVPQYAQASNYGIRALLKMGGEILDLLKRIAAKVGA